MKKRKNIERGTHFLSPLYPLPLVSRLLFNMITPAFGVTVAYIGFLWITCSGNIFPVRKRGKKGCWISEHYSNRRMLVSHFSDLYGEPAPIVSIRTVSASPLLQGLLCKLENFLLLSCFFV